ncbi:hypothetical protein ABZ545_06130 [Streptomyces abikoensis]|uniref:terpene synthase family protein n=1 Tax=Streptomyces abikoensis TaxID=97398 RepID=UPI00340AD6DD
MTTAAPHIAPGARYRLARLPRLLSLGRHPRTARLEQAHDQWLRAHYPFATAHERERFLSHRSTLWTSVCYPATDDERFHDLSRLTSFLFAFDDLFLSAGATNRRQAQSVLDDSLRVLDGRCPRTPHGTALAGIWAGMSRRMPPEQRCRLTAAVHDFSRGCHAETAARSGAIALDFDGYVRLRTEQSLAAWVYFVLTEYAAGVALDQDTRAALRPLHLACAEHLLFANDLFSFRAEHFAGDHINAVCVLTRSGTGLQESVDRLVSLVTTREHRVAALLRASADAAGPDVRRYLTALEHVVSGNLAQSRFAPRYHGTTAFIGRPIEAGTVTLWPDRTAYQPEE